MNSNFQINSSRFFLTYPQCTLLKEDVRDYFIHNFKVQEYVVAHELHANGDSHIHVYLRLTDPLRTRDCKFADLPGGFHGNYQGCRSAKSVIKYCTKSEDYVSNIDVSSICGKSSGRRPAMSLLVKRERTLADLVHEFPEFLHGYTRLKLDLDNFFRDTEVKKDKLPTFLPNPWAYVLPSRRCAKRRHYWIWSEQPNKGKTYHFARPLITNYNVHIRTGSEPYWTIRGYEECIILDEYNTAHFKYCQLNAMADGNFGYRVFHAGVFTLDMPLIIVLSNQSISTLYPHMNFLLYERFKEIELR